jgi:protease II
MPVDIDGNPISSEGYDVILIPPKEAQFKERPVWLRDIGRKFVDLPTELKFEGQYTQVTARNTQRVKDAVAEDTIYRPPHSDKPLALRPGIYRLEVTDKDKAVLGVTNITVN